MTRLVAHWFITALSFLLAAYLVPGIEVDGFGSALILALLWGVIGISIKPLLLILTLPITVVTLGLFTLVINGLLFWFLGMFIEGFSVSGFPVAILGAFVVTAAGWIGRHVLKQID